MPVVTITDYVLTGAGRAGVYVQLRDNASAAIFTSGTATDSNGQFSIGGSPPPPGDYAAYTSLTLVTPAWTLYDPHFRIAYTRGDTILSLVQAITEATLVAGLDASAGEVVTVTLTASRVVGLPVNPAIGQTLELIVTEGGAGGFTLTWPVGINTAWQPVPTVGAVTSLKLRYYGTTWQQVGGQVPVSQTGTIGAANFGANVTFAGPSPWFSLDSPAFASAGVVASTANADNQPQLINCLTAAATKGPVLIPAGSWNVKFTTTVPSFTVVMGFDRLSIINNNGIGAQPTVFINLHNTFPSNPQGGQDSNISFIGITITGPVATQGGVGGASIYMAGVTNVLCERVYINGNNAVGLRSYACINVTYRGCEAQNCAGGMWIFESDVCAITGACKVFGVCTDDSMAVYGGNTAIGYACTNVLIDGPIIKNATGQAITIGITNAQTVNSKDVLNWVCKGAVMDTGAIDGIQVGGGAAQGTIVGCVARNFQLAGFALLQRPAAGGQPPAGLGFGSPTDITVSGCTAVNCNLSTAFEYGGFVARADYGPMSGITFEACVAATCKNAGFCLAVNSGWSLKKCKVKGCVARDNTGGDSSGFELRISNFGLPGQSGGPAGTDLNGAITNVAVALVVDAFANFPAAGNFVISIDNELLLVTAGQGTVNWTVTRGFNDTIAAAHADEAVVAQTGYVDGIDFDDNESITTGAQTLGMVFTTGGINFLFKLVRATHNDVSSFAVNNGINVDGAITFGLVFKDNPGYNPVGFLIANGTAVPASGTGFVNTFRVDADVVIQNGANAMNYSLLLPDQTVAFGNFPIPIGQSMLVRVPAGATITLTYAGGAPTWGWFGE